MSSRGDAWRGFSWKSWPAASLLAFALVALAFLLQGNIGVNLADEGILWYCALHTRLGQVPVRDLAMTYEPGRYYWAAAWSYVFGGGLMGLRLSTAIFQAVGLAFGLAVARRVVSSWLELVAAGLTLLVWMFPRYKAFEPAVAMAAVFFAVRLVEEPTAWRHFCAGACAGLAAFFGKNLGVYVLLAMALASAWTHVKLDRRAFARKAAALAGGVVFGYSPALLMMAFVPGFARAFLDSNLYWWRLGATNITRPVPWPWWFHYGGMGFARAARAFLIGCAFLALPAGYAAGLIVLLRCGREQLRRRAVLLAAVCVGIFYAHHAFSRADSEHLAESIHPLLLAGFAACAGLGASRRRLAAAGCGLLLACSAFVALPYQPVWLKLAMPDALVSYRLGGDAFWLPRPQARFIDSFLKTVSQRAASGDQVFIAPYYPALYCLLGKTSPTRSVYFVMPEGEDAQRETIEALRDKDVKWAFIGEEAVDGRPDLGFASTDKLVWDYLNAHYAAQTVDVAGLGVRAFHRQ